MPGEPVFGPGTPAAQHVEINNGTQVGPARLTGQFGTRLDYTNAGQMTFHVDVVDVEGSRLTLFNDRSYEAAIVEAEEAAREWGVQVHDLVSAGSD